MAMVGRGSGQLLAAVILISIQLAANAPVIEEGTSQALQLAESNGDGRGCYYNFEHYDEGDRILTNEPCLNCTCHNRMLMCYLRVCPFTKAIGQDCTVEKKPDQCCPIITCPQVPVALLTSSTTSETPLTTTALGRPDNYGCILEDNTFYADGAQVPSDPRKPCELCYCIRNHTACVMQECTLNVEGCKPVYQEGVCCPVRYDCDYDEVPTTPKPVGLVTTPGGSSDCLHNGQIYRDGAMVMKDEKAPCEHCYCMRGDIVCAVQECGTPLEGRDCTPLERTPGQCCPNYHCANGTQVADSALTLTEKLPETVKEDSVEGEKHDSSESSSESDNSSEESQEVSEASPPKENASEENENHAPQELVSTEAPEQENVSNGENAHELTQTEVSQESTDVPRLPESTSVESIKAEDIISPSEQPDDSHSEASQHEILEAHAPHDSAKDPQITNEIPALPSIVEHTESTTTTEETPTEAARIPGEGSCLVEGKTYAHNTIVPTENPCQEVCRCFSSIVSCKPRDCPPAPSPDENCMPIITPGACCPTYMCDQKTSDAPQIQDHKIDNVLHEESTHFQGSHPSTQPPTFEEPSATVAPAVIGIPSDSVIPETNKPAFTPGSSDEGNKFDPSESESQKQEEPSLDHVSGHHESAEDNSQLNTNIVHDHEASLHGGQIDNLESVVNGNEPHQADDISTASPLITEATAKDEVAQVITTQKPTDSLTQTEQTVNAEDHETSLVETESPIPNHQEENSDKNHDQVVSNESDGQINGAESHDSEQQTETTTPAYYENESKPEHTSENLDNISEAQSQDEVNSSTIAAIVEQSSTEASIDDNISPNEKVEDQNKNEHELSHSDGTLVEENQKTVTNEPESEIQHYETTVIPAVSHDISHEDEHSLETHSEFSTGKPEENISTEKSEQLNSNTDTPHFQDEIEGTTSAPEDIVSPQSSEEPSNVTPHSPEQSEKAEDFHEEQISTDTPIDQENSISPTTMQSVSQEGQVSGVTEQPTHSEHDIIHHDSLPESSQHSVETAEKIKPQEQTGEIGEDIIQTSTESQNVQVHSDDSTSLVTEEQQGAEKPIEENKSEQIESDKINDTSEKNNETPAVTDENQKQEGLTTDEITSPPEKQDESAAAPEDEIPIISQGEINVTGMPPIESHVTEENLDHSHQELSHNFEKTTLSPHEDQEVHIPGPEGISVEKQPGNDNVSETQKEDNIPSQTEENTLPNSTEQSKVESPSQEGTESESNSQTSPEIINEINEEKESLNQITSDNTAQLIEDINQIIQNEVNNQLYHPGEENLPTNEQPELTPEKNDSGLELTTGVPSQSHIPGTTMESSSESELQKIPEEIKGNTETTATENTNPIEKEPLENQPEVSSESSDVIENAGSFTTPSAQEPSLPSAHEYSTEKQPEEEKEGEKSDSNTSEITQNEYLTSPPLIQHQSVSEEVQETETTEATFSTEAIPSSENQSGTDKSQNQNNIDTHELSTEQYKDKIVEADQTSPDDQTPPSSPINEGSLPLSEASSSVGYNEEQSPVTEEHNLIPEDVTHVISSDPQVPDSANQILEASGDGESISITEQTVHIQPAVEDESSHIPEEVEHFVSHTTKEDGEPSVPPSVEEAEHTEPLVPGEGGASVVSGEGASLQGEKDGQTSGDMTHQEDNTVHNGENIINEEKNEQISEVNQQHEDHHPVTIDSQSETTLPTHDTEKATEEASSTTSVTQEPPLKQGEIPEHQEIIQEHETESAVTEGHPVAESEAPDASSQTESDIAQPGEFAQQETVSGSQESVTEDQKLLTEITETLSVQTELPSEIHKPEAGSQEPSSDDNESPFEHQESSTDQQESSNEHQEALNEHHESTPEHDEQSSEQPETTSEYLETVTHQAQSVEHEEPPAEHQEPTVEIQEPAADHKEHSPENLEHLTEQEPLATHTEPPTEHHDSSIEHQESSTKQQEQIIEHHESSTEQQEQIIEHHESSTGQQEVTAEHHEPIVEHQESSTEQQEQIVEHQESSTEQQEQIIEHQESSTEQQEVPTEHHEPTVEHQESPTVQQETSSERNELTADHQESSTEQQEAPTEHHEPTVEHQESSTELQESSTEQHEPTIEHQEPPAEHQEPTDDHQEQSAEHQEPSAEYQEPSTEHQEPSAGHHEPSAGHHETSAGHQEPSADHQDPSSVHQEPSAGHQEPSAGHQEPSDGHQEPSAEHEAPSDGHQDPSSEIGEQISEHQNPSLDQHEDTAQHQETITEQQDLTTERQVHLSEHQESASEQQESTSDNQKPLIEHQTLEPDINITEAENQGTEPIHQEIDSDHHETVPEHHDTETGTLDASSAADNVVGSSTAPPLIETSSEENTLVAHPATEGPDAQKQPATEEDQKGENIQDSQKIEVPPMPSPASSTSKPDFIPPNTHKPITSSDLIQSIAHSTESSGISDISSSTQKLPIEEPSPMFPTWSQKPFEHHTTPEPHPPEENPYPSGFDPEYEDEEGVSYGPGTCRYGGKVYLSAQQIPRDDPCDFCFCFRSDIICLQQSCPPPIRGCYQETIKGFCCPRYECHVSMATTLNITTTTTTTTTTLPPHFFAHAYNGAATKAGCQVKGVAYNVGERIPSTSGPCLECRCGANGQMKCDPTICGPQEALLRQVMDAAVKRRRR